MEFITEPNLAKHSNYASKSLKQILLYEIEMVNHNKYMDEKDKREYLLRLQEKLESL